jgi:predicted house-cleaning noncanonical NTP pyrophosphatase (MazG superfamily)
MMVSENLKKNGYVILKNVLGSEQCQLLRDKCVEIIGNERLIDGAKSLKIKEFYNTFFLEKLLESMKDILKEEQLYLLPDMQVHRNIYKAGGWHTDSDSEIKHGYLENDDYKFYKVGIYLQENNINFDGGINILPKSHKFINFKKLTLGKIFYRSLIKLFNKFPIIFDDFLSKKVVVEPGDAVIFDSRIAHSPSVTNLKKNNRSKDKIVIYWNFSNYKYSMKYLENSIQRIKDDRKNDKSYINQITSCFPDNYAHDLVNLCNKNNIKFQSLGKETININIERLMNSQ